MADKRSAQPRVSAPAKGQQEEKLLASQQWQGPLPPPGALQQFNQIVPGSAERIIAMAEREQEHRIYIERAAIDTDSKLERRGQWLGATLYIGAIIGALAAVWLGAPWPVPIAMVGVTVVGVIKAIIAGRNGSR